MALGLTALLGAAGPATAAEADDAVALLQGFVQDVRSGRAQFVQTVTTPDGARRKASSGTLEFQRPGRFRFDYVKPYPQLLVGDGEKVWSYDPDLQQVTVRAFDQALGATPAALLTGGDLSRDFGLAAEPPRDGQAWVKATPKLADGPFQWMAVGFKGKLPATIEILDRFGQRTVMQLSGFEAGVELPATRFQFTPPPGTDVLAQ